MSIGDFSERLSRAMLVGTMFVGRLGVQVLRAEKSEAQDDLSELKKLLKQDN